MSDNNDTLLWNKADPLGSGASAKLDVARRPGFYEVIDPPDLPAGPYFLIVHRGFSSGPGELRVMQKAWHAETGDHYIRSFNGSTWGSWAAGGGGSSNAPFGLNGGTPYQAVVNQFAVAAYNDFGLGTGFTLSGNPPVAGGFDDINILGRHPRIAYQTDTGLGDEAGVRWDALSLTMSTGMRFGGMFSFPFSDTTPELFFGVHSQTSANPLASPIAGLIQAIGVGSDGLTNTLKIVHAKGAPGFIEITDGVNTFPIEGGRMYTYEFVVPAGLTSSEQIQYSVTDLTTGLTISNTLPELLDLPNTAELLTMFAVINNGGTPENAGFQNYNMWARRGT